MKSGTHHITATKGSNITFAACGKYITARQGKHHFSPPAGFLRAKGLKYLHFYDILIRVKEIDKPGFMRLGVKYYMAQQNIYDNDTFFAEYRKLREREVNANNLFELPTLISLLPNLEGKRILDLGCGTGERCIDYMKRGASKVTGVDISDNMLAVAREENSNPNITYLKMPMEDIGSIDGEFEVVISSLAFHYIDDFQGVVKNAYRLLCDGGVFLFSQEHPLTTCYSGTGNRWTRDENGRKLHANIADYCIEGRRDNTWFVEGVQIYHRMFSTIVNTLADTGFKILKMEEPYPTVELVKKYPEYYDLYHKPDFLFIKSIK